MVELSTRTYTSFSAALTAVTTGLNGDLAHQKVYLQRGDATGDQTHIGPVLAVHGNVGVVVFDGSDSSTKGAGIAKTYLNVYKIPAARVAYINFAAMTIDAAVTAANSVTFGGLKVTTQLGDATGQLSFDLAQAKQKWIATNQKKVAETLRGADLPAPKDLDASTTDGVLKNWLLQTKKIPLTAPVLVLWGRRSGAKGGLHPTQDHNTAFMRMIVEKALAKNGTVLLVGDFDKNEFDGLVGDTGADSKPGARKAIYLGAFWDAFTPSLDRQLQVRLFYILWRCLLTATPKWSLVHCGPRSGGLDAYGFSGQPMVYMVGSGEEDARMKKKVVDVFAINATTTTAKYSFKSFRLSFEPRTGTRAAGYKDTTPVEADADELIKQLGTVLATTKAF